MKNIILLGIALMVTSIVSVSAQTPRADARQKTQRTRIVDGRVDGDVTNREAAALNTEQRHIRRAERRAKADGVVTPREKMRLEHKQNKASRHIRRAKHNKIERRNQ